MSDTKTVYVAATSYATLIVPVDVTKEQMIEYVAGINPDEMTVEGTVITDENGDELFER